MTEQIAGSRSTQVVPMPDVEEVTHRYVQIDGVEVHVAEAGSGPPLVLLHGWPQNWYCWRRVAPLVMHRYRVIMPDLRGHGWSSAPNGGYDKDQLATDVLRTADQLGLDEFGLVGHDWGGWTGFLASLREPDRVTGLLALGIPPPFQRLTPAALLQAWR